MTRTATPPTAVRRTYERLIPVAVRRVLGFDLKGMVSIGLWLARRRHGVPPGAVAVSYSRAQTPVMLVFLGAMVAELVAVELLLRAIDTPAGLRNAILALDGYTILIVLAVIAACITRPHVVSADEVRVRYGAFFDLRIPRDHISDIRRAARYGEAGTVKVTDDVLAVAVSSQTNLTLELTEPIEAVRPLGRRVQVRTIRLFADDPAAALRALRIPGVP